MPLSESDDTHKPKTPQQKFDQQTEILLHPSSPESRSYFGFVQRLLYQYRLSKTYQVKEVMAEAHLRGLKQIDQDKQIRNPLAWYKSTSLNIIREWRRQQDKAQEPRIDLTKENPLQGVDKLIFVEDMQVLKQAYRRLDGETQEVLYLRIVEDQSWKEISKTLVLRGKPQQSSNALRQKGFRGIKRLRKIYYELRDSILVD